MQPNLYEDRCRCNEELSIEKEKASVVLQSEGKPLKYPNSNDILLLSKTFQIKYEKKLSLIAKLVLNSFQNKSIMRLMIFYIYLN